MLENGATRQQVAGKLQQRSSGEHLRRYCIGKNPGHDGCRRTHLIVTRFTAGYSATGADTDGMVGRIRCSGYATEEQEKAISQRT